MQKKSIIIFVLFIGLILVDTFVSFARLKPSVLDRDVTKKSETYGNDLSSLEKGTVLRVIDGDTFVADVNNKQTTIRLIGIDTPESVHTDASLNTVEGNIASDYTKGIMDGKTVYLEYDVDLTDYYGRTLAYVYLEDGSMMQELLLKDGIAKTMTVQPNSKYADYFLLIQREAQQNEVGFWNGYFTEE